MVEFSDSVKAAAIPCIFMRCIRSRDTELRSFSGVIGIVLSFVSIIFTLRVMVVFVFLV